MSPYQTLVVCIRLLAIWLFIQLLGRIFTTSIDSVNQGASGDTWWWLAAFGLLSVACLLLALFPFFLARALLAGTATEVDPPAASTMETDRWFALARVEAFA